MPESEDIDPEGFGPSLLASLRPRLPEMLEYLRAIVESESPSADVSLLHSCADVVARVGTEVLGEPPERIDSEGKPHLLWSFGAPRVLLVGHFDTVWPVGTLERIPFDVIDGVARGPGIFDMKAGIIQGMYALASIDTFDGVSLFLNSDEEIGSHSSKSLIGEIASQCEAVLVLEPSEQGALKIARKGTASYLLTITGRAAHAGLEPHKGVNSAVEVAHQILDAAELSNPQLGTTVTPTLTQAGTATNTVPASAEAWIDVRARSEEELDRVDAALAALSPRLEDARLQVTRRSKSPVFPESASTQLFALANKVASSLGIADLAGVEVGGGSDGNHTAARGIPTLDGMGAVGGGAHAETEHIDAAAMPVRAALVAGVLRELLRGSDLHVA